MNTNVHYSFVPFTVSSCRVREKEGIIIQDKILRESLIDRRTSSYMNRSIGAVFKISDSLYIFERTLSFLNDNWPCLQHFFFPRVFDFFFVLLSFLLVIRGKTVYVYVYVCMCFMSNVHRFVSLIFLWCFVVWWLEIVDETFPKTDRGGKNVL